MPEDARIAVADEKAVRFRLCLKGAVQGVGFRPFVYRLASKFGVTGWVKNSEQGVVLEAEGPGKRLEEFFVQLYRDKPNHATIVSEEREPVPVASDRDFQICESQGSSDVSAIPSAWVMPDLATCALCLDELRTPSNRRYRYPFINCTQCGPRYSIVESLPYERSRTTMREFKQCSLCEEEFNSPSNRRFHAEPNACPKCGPKLRWRRGDKASHVYGELALVLANQALRDGAIVAVKSVGGFHLMVDARNEKAVQRLRERKHRPEKPFALLYPSPTMIERDAELTPTETRVLLSTKAPIVLLSKRPDAEVAANVVGQLPFLAAMLPSNPLHCLLMSDLGFPCVATSGNISEEPICIDDDLAYERLRDVADAFLGNDRTVSHRADDSIVRIVAGRELVLRGGRGYAPMSWRPAHPWANVLATGGQLKNTIALSNKSQVFLSAHIGDLGGVESLESCRKTMDDYKALYRISPNTIALDAHPGYSTNRIAEESNLKIEKVFHHEAHVISCLVDNGAVPPALGIAWDGSGYGEDETVWGGEFLAVRPKAIERVAHFRQFRLPGGEKAVREPRRVALAVLFEAGLSEESLGLPDLPKNLRDNLWRMCKTGLNSPLTSSVGRLFDGVAALLGVTDQMTFEGQAAMKLEGMAMQASTATIFPFRCEEGPGGKTIIDWVPMIRELIEARDAQRSLPELALAFHWTLIEMAVAVAKKMGEKQVVLTGGCFQNRLLTERALLRLREEGFEPLWHLRVPPNDGGIALGQLAAVTWRKSGRFPCV